MLKPVPAAKRRPRPSAEEKREPLAVPPLPRLMIEAQVREALLEDLGRAGDITSDAIIPADLPAETALVARKPGVVAGLDVALLAFTLIDPAIAAVVAKQDGSRLQKGDVIATLSGRARSILTAERVALNFLCHLSGIASATAEIVDSVRGTKARVICTRKTLPGLRNLQKYAIRVGGGFNHRFGLDDAVLIKDNHIAAAGGIRKAVERARAAIGHLVKIELEVDTLAQLEEGLAVGVDAILLDNMDLDQMRRAVAMVAGRAVIEASGGITPETAPAIAATGVDLLSLGWLTHSVRQLDIGLDYR
jgi:nicotinate-nucleotide pyrophosphorylase (carboxylating)